LDARHVPDGYRGWRLMSEAQYEVWEKEHANQHRVAKIGVLWGEDDHSETPPLDWLAVRKRNCLNLTRSWKIKIRSTRGGILRRQVFTTKMLDFSFRPKYIKLDDNRADLVMDTNGGISPNSWVLEKRLAGEMAKRSVDGLFALTVRFGCFRLEK
jgi:hypothetical protein